MTGPRRPLASRDTGWARWTAAKLAQSTVTPNAISMASMGFAALSGAAFWASQGTAWGWLLCAALGIQLRLLCNLLDGMVAVEGGKSTPDGGFWNEVPDRVSDLIILVGAGLGAGDPALGWAAAALAILTAYMREVGSGLGLEPDFVGPMAKPHRMALMTGVALAAIALPVVGPLPMLTLGLWVVAIGSGITALRRAARILSKLRT